MELRVFDKTVQPLGAIDELASLLWHTKYFDVGTFSLLAPITDNNSRLLVEGNLITKHDGKKGSKDRRRRRMAQGSADNLRTHYQRRERLRAVRGTGLYA